jgi:hypothetical protein
MKAKPLLQLNPYSSGEPAFVEKMIGGLLNLVT